MAFRLQHEPPVPLNPQRTFEQFVVGPSNAVAFGVSQAIAIQAHDCRSPLVICGRSGLGKTHLAQALVHHVRDRHPDLDAVYLTANALVAEIVGAFRKDEIEALRRSLARADVLVVDDAHQLAGRAEEELVAVIDAVHAARHQMVLTTLAPPHELQGVRPDLRRRLEQGSVVLLEPPSLETRIAIAARKAAALGMRMPPEVAYLAAEHAPANVGELEGVVMRLCVAAELRPSRLTLALAREVLVPPPEEPLAEEPLAEEPLAEEAPAEEPLPPRAPLDRPRRGRGRAAANPPGDLAAGVAELREFIRDVGGDRIGEPRVRHHQVDVPLVARDGERYVLRILVGTYLTEPPSCVFVDEAGRWSADAWPASGADGPFRSPEFICSPPTAEFYAYHPHRVYHYGEGSLTNAVAAVFQALQAPAYAGRRSGGRARPRFWRRG